MTTITTNNNNDINRGDDHGSRDDAVACFESPSDNESYRRQQHQQHQPHQQQSTDIPDAFSWVTTKKKPGRRVKSWLKSNLSNLTSAATTTLQGTNTRSSLNPISPTGRRTPKDDDSSYSSSNTIDHALLSLYSLDAGYGAFDTNASTRCWFRHHHTGGGSSTSRTAAETAAASSSYVPTTDYDWILDDQCNEQVKNSRQMISALYEMESLESEESWFHHIQEKHKQHQLQLEEESKSWKNLNENKIIAQEIHHQDDDVQFDACFECHFPTDEDESGELLEQENQKGIGDIQHEGTSKELEQQCDDDDFGAFQSAFQDEDEEQFESAHEDENQFQSANDTEDNQDTTANEGIISIETSNLKCTNEIIASDPGDTVVLKESIVDPAITVPGDNSDLYESGTLSIETSNSKYTNKIISSEPGDAFFLEESVVEPAITVPGDNSDLDESVTTEQHQDHPITEDLPLFEGVENQSLITDKASEVFDIFMDSESSIFSSSTNDEGLDDEAGEPISLRLPVTDLKTLPGRYTRRRQERHRHARKSDNMVNSNNINTHKFSRKSRSSSQHLYEMFDDLPKYYFTNELDDTVSVLKSLPWKYVSHIWEEEINNDDDEDDSSSSSFSPYELETQQSQLQTQRHIEASHSTISKSEILAGLDHVDDYVTTQLSKLDAANEKISHMLLERIQPHQDRINNVNENLHSLENNITIAQMYLERSQKSMRLAHANDLDDGSGLAGIDKLLLAWDQLDQYKNLSQILDQLNMIFTKEQEITNAIQGLDSKRTYREYQQIITDIGQLQQMAHSKSFVNLPCLDDLRSNRRIGTMMYTYYNRMHVLSESISVRLCRMQPKQKRRQPQNPQIRRNRARNSNIANQPNHAHIQFGSLFQEYQTLLRSILDVDNYMIQNQYSGGEESMSSEQFSSSLAGTWSQTILDALLFEAERALAMALIDPIEDTNDASCDYDKELMQLGFDVDQNWGDTRKLRSLTHDLASIRFDYMSDEASYLSPVCHRLVALLTDVLHAHYLIVEWTSSAKHRATAGKSHNNVVEEEEKKEKEKDEKNMESSNISDSMIENPLEGILLKLIATRNTLWTRCEDVLTRCLEEYLKFAKANKKYFVKKTDVQSSTIDTTDKSVVDDSLWLQDLIGLNQVFVVIYQFLSMKSEFLDTSEKTDIENMFYRLSPSLCIEDGENDDYSTNKSDENKVFSPLCEQMCNVFRKNLRYVHVEAMQTLGGMLSKENWKLIPMAKLATARDDLNFITDKNTHRGTENVANVDNSKTNKDKSAPIKKLIFDILLDMSREEIDIKDRFRTRKKNDQWKILNPAHELKDIFLNFSSQGNPFLFKQSVGSGSYTTAYSDYSSRINKQSKFQLHSGKSEHQDDHESFQSMMQQSDQEDASNKEVFYELVSRLAGGGVECSHNDDCNYHSNALSYARISSASIIDGIFPWISRLLKMIEKLPIIVEDISAVFANICDLYFTTVFRLCAGTSINERIILGIDAPNPAIAPKEGCGSNVGSSCSHSSAAHVGDMKKHNSSSSLPADSNRPNSSMFAFRRSLMSTMTPTALESPGNLYPQISSTLEADMCAPLISEMESGNILSTRRFIERAQDSLRDVVNLDKVDHWMKDECYNDSDNTSTTAKNDIMRKTAQLLEKRDGAIHSCLVVAAILDIACHVAKGKLSSKLGKQFRSSLTSLESYTKAVLAMSPTLLRISCKISSARSIMAKNIVQEVVKLGNRWEECELTENPNDYVEELCFRCSKLWSYLCISESKLPLGILKQTWTNIISSGYICLLEGFSRIISCSTEGRALMSMDLASYTSGISSSSILERLEYQLPIDSPPAVSPARGRQYVDTYIKVFYYPKSDVINWINANHKEYLLNNSLSLVITAVKNNGADTENDKNCLSVVELMGSVTKLYENINPGKSDISV